MNQPAIQDRGGAAALLLAMALLLPAAAVPVQAQNSGVMRVAPAPEGAARLLGEAQALLEQRRAEEAWQRLAARELEFAGDPQFDYLLGLAALDSGRRAEAIFAFRRLLAAQPDFDGARLELARALYETGDYEGAAAQFSYLLTRRPPPEAALVINRYLAAIDQQGARRQQAWLAWVEGSAGWDSNANSSTSDQEFLGFELDPDNVETSSTFLDVAGGGRYRAGLGGGWFGDLGARGYYRLNPDARFVDQASLSGQASVLRAFGAWRWQGGLSLGQDWRDGSRNLHNYGLDTRLSRRLSEHWELALSLSATALRYDEPALEVLDVNRYLGAFGVSRLFPGALPGRISLTVLGGADDERRAGSPYGNARYGLRLGGDAALSTQTLGFLQVGWLRTDFDRSPGFFGGNRREDDQFTVLVGAEVRDWPAAGWTLTPRLRWVRQDSTIALYEFDRVEVVASLRRSFAGPGQAR